MPPVHLGWWDSEEATWPGSPTHCYGQAGALKPWTAAMQLCSPRPSDCTAETKGGCRPSTLLGTVSSIQPYRLGPAIQGQLNG